ncbi:MAG: 2'-5' RNA ligase family protein, partial [Bacteroidota bacterium]
HMSLKPSLYFIALIPRSELSDKITTVKNDFTRHYHSSKALNVMPHITLQNPFSRMESFETEFHLRLQDFFSTLHAFNVQLSGYDCFDNKTNPVIFINVVKNDLLFELHKKMIYFLREEMNFSAKESSYTFHPHFTVAYRDLTDEQFNKASPIYKNKTFEGSFVSDAVYLLKHDYRKWNVLSRFDLVR